MDESQEPTSEPAEDRSAGSAGEHESRPWPRRPSLDPIRLEPLLPRRQSPWIVVEVDGTPQAARSLTWALHEAARREATVVAVGVLEEPTGPLATGRAAWRDADAVRGRLDAEVCRALAETGVRGRVRTSVLERPVFEALLAAAHGADLVLVDGRGKALLRQAVPRPPVRRLARGA
jgi:nucleotide-binding universal stress UspA family protein